MILVMDASSLIAFYSEREINEPPLLHKLAELGHHLVVPIAVVKEIEKGRKRTFSILKEAITEGKIAVHKTFSTNQVSNLQKRYPNLHEGEIQVLILGMELEKEKKEYFCVIDEGSATKVAKKSELLRKEQWGCWICSMNWALSIKPKRKIF